MPRLKTSLQVTEKQRELLKQLQSKRTGFQNLVIRATMILKTDEGIGSQSIAQQLEVAKNTVLLWRKRWVTSYNDLLTIENQEDSKRLMNMIKEVLSDAPRPGAPSEFTEEQELQIVARACSNPMESDIPRTHWTQESLAAEVQKMGIVKSISSSQIGRILKKYGRTTT